MVGIDFRKMTPWGLIVFATLLASTFAMRDEGGRRPPSPALLPTQKSKAKEEPTLLSRFITWQAKHIFL